MSESRKRHICRRLLLWGVPLLLAVVLIGSCNPLTSPDTGDTRVSVSGTLPVANLARLVASPRATGTPAIHSALALPISGNRITTADIDASIPISIAADGSFSVALRRDSDWLVLLLDKDETLPMDKVVGYVGIAAGTDAIVRLPIGDAADSLQLGTLVEDGDVFITSDFDAQSALNISAADLAILGRTNNIFKSAKNLYLSYDTNTGIHYSLTVKITTNWNPYDAKDAYIDIAAGAYELYGYAFGINTNGLNIADIPALADHSRTIALYPPVAVNGGRTDVDSNWSFDDPITTALAYADGPNVVRDDISVWAFFDADGAYLELAAEGNDLQGEIPSGPWYLCIYDGLAPTDPTQEYAAVFDAQVMWPMDSSDLPRVFLPAIRIRTNGITGIVEGIDTQWLWYDTTDSDYKSVPNGLLSDALGQFCITFRDNDSMEQDFWGYQATNADISENWYYPDDFETNGYELNSVFINYELNGVRYTFEGQTSIP